MQRKSPLLWFARRLQWVMIAGALLHPALVAAQPRSCPTELQPKVSTIDGIETIEGRADGVTISLQMIRLSRRDWTIRLFDMRDLRKSRVRLGDYSSPTYSLAEVAAIAEPSRVLSSAGMTESYYAPVPAGLLKVGGSIRNKANLSSRILDGVLCVRPDNSVRLLSELTSIGRRIPRDAGIATAECVHALQAGPMLVDGGNSLAIGPFKQNVARVFAAVGRDGRFILGYSPQATTFHLACMLSAPILGIDAAIGLQSDDLGGVILGKQSGFAEATWGRSNATIASAIEVTRRRNISQSQSQPSIQAPSARGERSR